jgi:hypothetical protein
MKVVFHIDMDSTPIFELMLGNIKNLLKAESAEVSVVANGYAVKLFTRQNLAKYESEIRDLREKGVSFFVCENALRNLVEINPENVSDLCEVIPAGIVMLIRLQKEGFAYVKP